LVYGVLEACGGRNFDRVGQGKQKIIGRDGLFDRGAFIATGSTKNRASSKPSLNEKFSNVVNDHSVETLA
jgi:hypothetical protein